MFELKYGDKNEHVKLLQRALNEKLSLSLIPDGGYGKLTMEAVKSFQDKNKLPITGVYDSNTQALLEPYISSRFITETSIAKASKEFGLSIPLIKAFREVESNGNAFLNNGKCSILFERHKFYQCLTKKIGKVEADKIAKQNNNLCSSTPGGYIGGIGEWSRIELARVIDKDCANASASWGAFQLMGFNYKVCGYSSIDSFVKAMQDSEVNHLTAVMNFIKNNTPLYNACKNLNFNKIAEYYNGPNYAINNYHNKLAAAYKKYS